MEIAECQAAVKRLNLKKTNSPSVGICKNGIAHSIPNWAEFTPPERAYLLRRLELNVRGFDGPSPEELRPLPPAG